MSTLDERDLEILWTISETGTRNIEKLEDMTGIPRSTISYRINNLRDKGVLANEVFDMDLEELGLELVVISEIHVDVRSHSIDDVGESIADIEGVNQVYYTMGETDFISIAYLPAHESIQRLMNEFGSLDGILRTNSKYVVGTYKNNRNPLSDYALDTIIRSESFGNRK